MGSSNLPTDDQARADGLSRVLKPILFVLAPASMVWDWTDHLRKRIDAGDPGATWMFLLKAFIAMMLVGFFIAGTPLAKAIVAIEPWMTILLALPIWAIFRRARMPSKPAPDGDDSTPHSAR